MNVKNCRKCGKIFNHAVGPVICPACKDSLEAKFIEVKEYIRDHGKATIPQVCEECDVESTLLRQWIREERLQFSDDSPIKVNCEGCGAMIGSGRFCEKCKANLMNGLNATLPKSETKVETKVQQKSGQKMRFL